MTRMIWKENELNPPDAPMLSQGANQTRRGSHKRPTRQGWGRRAWTCHDAHGGRGRVMTKREATLPKDSEGRTGDGPWLTLDQPLLVDHWERPPTDPPSYASCYKWQKIAILPGADWDKAEAQIAQIKNWDNQHVTIDGELDHFESGLVSPNVYIRVMTIKKD